MSPVPGVDVSVEARPRGTTLLNRFAVAHMPAITERGPADRDVKLESLGDYLRVFGDRTAYATGYDAVDVLFRMGVPAIYLSRVLPATADKATHNLMDRAGVAVATLRVEAKDPGDYGNRLSVAVIDGDNPGDDEFVLVISYDGDEVERSYNLTSPAEAVAWGTYVSRWVNVVDLASVTAATNNNPAVAAIAALAGGDDDRELIADADWQAALDRLLRIHGAGQVLMPGRTTSDAHAMLFRHAKEANRFALVDPPNTANAATVSAATDAVRAEADVDPTYGLMPAGWVLAPGVTRLVPRVIPPSVAVAGLIALEDERASVGTIQGVGSAPAGIHGQLHGNYVYDVANYYTEDERQALHRKGVSVFRLFGGTNPGPRLYGYTTVVDRDDRSEPNAELLAWQFATHARLRMAIVSDGEEIAESYVEGFVDGKGHRLAAFRGELLGMLGGYYQAGFLYGDTAPDAFSVDVGAAVNPPDQLELGTIAAAIAVKMSPLAEHVQLYVVKYAITERIAA